LREAANSAPHFISVDDVLLSLLLLRVFPIAIRDSPEVWAFKAGKVAKMICRFFRGGLQPFFSRIPRILMESSGLDREAIGLQLFTAYVLEVIEVVAAGFGRPMPTNKVHLEGVSHVRQALDKGRGVVFWCEPCISGSLWNKAALAGAGFDVHHLSLPVHSFSRTRFGIRYLNRFSRKAEDRYLAERILKTNTRRVFVARRIMELLNNNKVVSLTATRWGTQTITTRVLGTEVRVASGGPHFALRARAPLLPVFSFRNENEYVVEVQEPIDVGGATRQVQYQSAVDDYARRLGDYVQNHPTDWLGWYDGTYTETQPY
jgi:predicted LPLAT superfamily acyltransferase